MPGKRPDIPLLILVCCFPVLLITYSYLPVFALILAIILDLGMWTYAAYWAFSIRRALNVRLYRNQALGVGLVVIAEVLDFIAHSVFYNLDLYVAYFVAEAMWTLIVFYFIDASILAGRRSDPLLRDSIHWRSLRVVLWPAIVAVTVAMISVTTYLQVVTETVPFSTLILINTVFNFLALASVGVVGILITALRSKDPRLHAHFAWIGAFFAFVLLPALPGNNIVVLPVIIGVAMLEGGLLGEGYALYRSARALVPLNRIGLD